MAADSTNSAQKVRNAGRASAPRGSAKWAEPTAAVGPWQQPRHEDHDEHEYGSGNGRKLPPRRNRRSGCARRDPGAPEKAEARHPVQRGEDRPPDARLECDTVCVRRHLDDAEAGSDHAGRGHERREGGRERGGGEPAAREQQSECSRPPAATPGREPAGCGQEQRRRQRDDEDDESELAAVEPEPALQRRQSRRPGAVERAEGHERDRERDVRGPKPSRRHCGEPN